MRSSHGTHFLQSYARFFGESGKQVISLFTQITAMLDDPDIFLIIIIDEIESLSASRTAQGDQEGVRVVNALLTSLDKIKSRENCVCLTTSNQSTSIDPAFIDRADLVQFIGNPGVIAVQGILKQSVDELIRVGIVDGKGMEGMDEVIVDAVGRGVSGRALRKLLFLAVAEVGDMGRIVAGGELVEGMKSVLARM
jgi:SpoVK/Ycf46/Vps4 family AAA+-type ATPase